MDRFGATPLRDSFSARRAEIATYLRKHGAYLGDSTEGFVVVVVVVVVGVVVVVVVVVVMGLWLVCLMWLLCLL